MHCRSKVPMNYFQCEESHWEVISLNKSLQEILAYFAVIEPIDSLFIEGIRATFLFNKTLNTQPILFQNISHLFLTSNLQRFSRQRPTLPPFLAFVHNTMRIIKLNFLYHFVGLEYLQNHHSYCNKVKHTHRLTKRLPKVMAF